MSLSGQQRKELQSALIDAFPDIASLEQMLSFELNQNLREIAGQGSLQDIVFELIKKANSQGWIEDLVCKAYKYNSGNLKLRTVAENIINNSLPNEYLSEDSHLNNNNEKNSHSPFSSSLLYSDNKNHKNENIKQNNRKESFFSLNISTIAIAFLATGLTVLFSAKFLESRQNTKTTSEFPSVLLNASDYYNIAKSKYAQKDYEGTVQYYTKAIELNPKDAYAYANRGLARQYLHDNDGALEDYNQAIKIGECGCFYEKRAGLFLIMKNPDRAIKDYQEAVYLYRQKKDHENVKTVLEKLKKLCSSQDNDKSSRCKTFNLRLTH